MVISNLTLDPYKQISSYFSLCHWNANSILAHSKLSLLTAYNITYKYDIICVSETYLNSSVDSSKLSIPGYYIIRADPQMTRKGVGFAYTLMKT